MNIQGKTAFITGASLRIGRAIALDLAASGADIVIHFNRSRKAAEELQKEISILGRKTTLVSCDFSGGGHLIESRIKKMAGQIFRELPAVDILVNNASVFYPTPVGKTTEKEWDDLLSVNLKAPFFLSQEFGQRMVRQKGGKIINLIDWTITRPSPNYLPYAAAKAGLHALTKGMAKAFAPHVQVNSIAPGPILPVRGMSSSAKKKVMNRTLLKRFGSPDDICAAVRFLVCGTDYVTGALIPVDGGSTIA